MRVLVQIGSTDMRVPDASYNSQAWSCVPDCRRSWALIAETSQAELPLADTVHQLDTGDRIVCSDMWQLYLTVIPERCSQTIHILDCFHIVAKMNAATGKSRLPRPTLVPGSLNAQRMAATRD